jgi:hypothetical protein
MFSRFQQPASLLCRGLATSAANNTAVAVMGASGGLSFIILRLRHILEFGVVSYIVVCPKTRFNFRKTSINYYIFRFTTYLTNFSMASKILL